MLEILNGLVDRAKGGATVKGIPVRADITRAQRHLAPIAASADIRQMSPARRGRSSWTGLVGWVVFRESAAIVACLSLLLPCASSAVTGNQPGHLAVHIAVSNSPAYIEQWVSTPFRAAVTIHRIQEVERGKTAYIAFLVTGQSHDASLRSKVAVGVRVLRPDSSVAYEDSSYAHISCRNDGRIGFTMADPALDFGVEGDDPLGQWIIEATARDHVTGTVVSATHPLVVRLPARVTH